MNKYINGNLKNPNLFLFFAIVSSAIVLILVGTHTYNVMEDMLENSRHAQIERSYVSDIRFFDEVLTNSALLATSTGEARWEKRYRIFEPKLESAIQKLIRLESLHVTPQTLKLTDNANDSLVAMENHVFELVRDRKLNEASTIITGNEYARQKAIYSEGLFSFIKQRELETTQKQLRFQKAANRSKWFFGLIILLLAIVWLPIEYFFRKSRAQMLQQNQELELQIQARKESESALQESKKQIEKSQEQLQESIKISSIGLWEWNMQTNVAYLSPEFKKQIGYDDDEVQSSSEFYFSRLHPEDAIIVNEAKPKLLDGAIDKLELEYRFLHKDGSYRWMLSCTSLQRDQNGKPLRLFGSHIDITERKKAEEKIIMLAHAVKNSADCIAITDKDYKIIFVNDSFCKVYGFKEEEIIDQQITVITSMNNLPEVTNNLYSTLAKKEIWTGEVLNKSKDGNDFPVQLSLAPLLNDKGELIAFVGILRDITERKRAEETIYNERLLLRTLIDNIPDSIYSKDLACRKTLVNLTDQRFMGAKSDAEVLGKDDFDFYPKEVAEKFFADDQSVIQTGRPILNREEFIPGEKGQKRWLLTSKLPLRDRNGQIIGLVGIGRDITERRYAEEALRNERLLLRTVIDNIPDSIYCKDTSMRKTLANLTDLRRSGVKTEAEILGKTDFDLYPKELAEGFYADDQTVLHTGQPVINREEYVLDEDGQKLWHLTSKLPIKDDNGNIIGIVGVGINITSRKQAEEALRASQQLIEGIINAIPVRIFWKDKNLVYLGCNKIFAQDAGFSDPKDLIGKDDYQMGWLDQAELYRSGDRQVIESGIPILLNEEPQTTPEGNTIIMLTNKIPLQNSRGEIYGILGTSMNVTDRIATMQEVKLKNEELSKINAEKDKFFSIIAHDLRSPFNGFLGLTQIMAEDLPNLTMDEIQKISLSMRKSATNLFRLLENLLEWAKMKQGLIIFEPKVVKLLPIVEESISMMLEPTKNKKIIILYNIPNDMEVFADSKMLQTVIRNLVSNAVKFTPKGGKVILSAKDTNNKSVEISISDTGIGMSQELIENLFRLDVQTSRKGTEDEPSSGLGLLLCKEFIEKHGGKLRVESEEGKGSVFNFTIPDHVEPMKLITP